MVPFEMVLGTISPIVKETLSAEELLLPTEMKHAREMSDPQARFLLNENSGRFYTRLGDV